jgi:hypothetical protein
MSIWVRLFKDLGRVTAVYRLSGVTYVEIAPSCAGAWQAIRDRCDRLNAVADIKSN